MAQPTNQSPGRDITIDIAATAGGPGDWALTARPNSGSKAVLFKTWRLLDRLHEQLLNELYIGGRTVYQWLSPAQPGCHWVVFSPLILMTMLAAFIAIICQLPLWLTSQAAIKCDQQKLGVDCYQALFLEAGPTGPAYLTGWISGQTSQALPFEYLRQWGSLYAPDLADGQSFRWLTSQFVHLSTSHLLGNMSLFLAVAICLERWFGWWRVGSIWMISVITGEMMSVATEDPCTQVVGASGGVFGLVGMFMANLLLNRHHLMMPLYHTALNIILFSIFLVAVLSQGSISHMSHVGGWLGGFLPSLVLLPNRRLDALHVVLPVLGLLGFAMLALVLPVWVYLHVLPLVNDMHCNAAPG